MFLKLTNPDDRRAFLISSERITEIWPDGAYAGSLIELIGREECIKVKESVDAIWKMLRGGDA